ncbi:MAG: hypothetical protein A7316_05940 [Candidatus Altiarchaeales archaeon WOR_SM1_86-2]|nr:MAG: hypothetical protein A7316_05940 [Candidatus Altiarchaeales archaeon WOR_SM1_86-2]
MRLHPDVNAGLKHFTLILVSVIIPAILISGCIGPETEKPKADFSSPDDCQSACSKAGYEKGDCKWPTEAKPSYVNLGSCLIENSRHCGNEGQCNCYCYPETVPEGTKDCATDDDCVVFGETGDCNCGCYNKDNPPSGTGGECFCSAPDSCKCVNGKCEGVFEEEIESFEECVEAGHPVMESYPPRCAVPGGPTFTEDNCQYKKGEDIFILTISDAKSIAKKSECGDRLKETYVCNDDTGTYWIDLDMEKEGCNPACVVNVETREAKINWRCTGVLSKEQACIDSGGTVRTGLCCKSVGDFPNTCTIGACGCSPENSHEVKICDCGEGKCFDGSTCVPEINSFDDCVRAGYPIMESYPRQCRTPDSRTFTEEISLCAADDECVPATCCHPSKCVYKDQAPYCESVACTLECRSGTMDCGYGRCACIDNKCQVVWTEDAGNGSSCSGMGLGEAKQIAVNSECGDRLKDTYTCNNHTGTWWIDLDIEEPGCNPACVVNAVTGEAEINWRCTGALPPENDTGAEVCTAKTGEGMNLSEALKIADASMCVEEGILTADYMCNNYTGTWWIDLDPFTENPLCNPACVVNVVTGEAEINWRCTGLMPPEI